ncbi:MAG: amidase family protein [Halioglobus sp.]
MSRRALLALAGGTVAGFGSIPLSQGSALTNAKESRAVITGDYLLDFDAVGLAELVRAGEVTPLALIQAAIGRITALEGRINAMTTLTTERAIKLAPGIPVDSVFAGVPTVLKDLVDFGGVRRTNGSLLSLANVPNESVKYVKAMETAGLNILGMTNTPEFASLALTDNVAFGATRNPWSLEHSAGGSSGGSAAAVAAGYVPLAHGTDGGGSNRIPASCCGVLGMKPSRYRQVSGEGDGGHMLLRTHQCLSRTVRDSATLLAATENHQNQAGYPPVGLVTGQNKRRLRIAYSVNNCFGEAPQTGVREVLEKSAMLCQSLGHEIEEVRNPLDGEALFAALESIMLVGMPSLLAMVEKLSGRPAEEAGILSPATVAIGRYGSRFTGEDYQKGIAYMDRIAEEFSGFFTSYDVWLTPVMSMETPKIGWVDPHSSGSKVIERNRQMLAYTAAANGLGAPAMSVPLFHSSVSSLPVGSQFLAAPGDDRTLYELAYELEAAQPWADRWAPNSAKFIA